MSGNKFRNVGDIIKDVTDECKKISYSEGLVTGVSTGFYDLDYITRGLKKGNLVLLAGRRHMGKTAFALSLVYNAIVKQKTPTVVFSPAFTDKQIMLRLMSMDSGLFYKDIMNGLRSSNDWDKLKKSTKEFVGTPLFVDDSSLITVKDIRERCINIKADKKPELIIIDYLQLISTDAYNNESVTKKDIIRSLKKLAVEMDCPVLVISELSSDGEREWNSCPEISDIDDADYTKQYADMIILIYLDKLKDNTGVEQNEAKLTIIKNRDGFTGRVKLRPDLGHSRFLNIV